MNKYINNATGATVKTSYSVRVGGWKAVENPHIPPTAEPKKPAPAPKKKTKTTRKRTK